MNPGQLKAAGFSDAEVSEYAGLQKAGFSEAEIEAHYATPSPPPLVAAPPPPQSLLDRIKGGAKSIVQQSRPYLEGGGAALGGVLAAPAAIISGPFAPAVEAAGVAGGAMIGGQLQNVAEEIAGVKSIPGLVGRAKEIVNAAPEAITTGVSGPLIGRALSGGAKVVGKAALPLLGRIGGAGTGAVDTALRSGKNIKGFGLNPQTDFARAVRGEVSGEEIVDVVRGSLGQLQARRGAEYAKALSALPEVNVQAMGKVKNQIGGLLKRYRVERLPGGEVNFRHSPLSPKGAKDVTEIVNLVDGWGNHGADIRALTNELPKVARDEERVVIQGQIQKLVEEQKFEESVLGMDVLKRKLDNFYSESSDARQFVTALRNEVGNGITTAVPQYGEMTKKYAEATNMLNDIRRATGTRGNQNMTGRTAANATLTKLSDMMKKDVDFRRDLLGVLSEGSGGGDIQELIAGNLMSKYLPGSNLVLLGEGYAVLNHINPETLAVLAVSSPRVQAMFLQQFGRALAEFGPTTSKTLGYAIGHDAQKTSAPEKVNDAKAIAKKLSDLSDEDLMKMPWK